MMIVKRRQTLIAGLTICHENPCCLECVHMTSRRHVGGVNKETAAMLEE